jgi:hypothetical protein
LLLVADQQRQRLEWDVENKDAIELSIKERSLVQEGIEAYKKGDVVSLQDFINKRN